jgi:hypothetical protein
MSTRQLRRRRAPPVTQETNRRLVFEKSRRCSASEHEHEPEPDSDARHVCRTCAVADVEEDDGQGTATRAGALPSEKPFQRLDYAADVVLGDGQRQSISGPRALLHDALDLP